MSANRNLHAARKAKRDEHYTRLLDIENELRHYKDHFKDKVVYCNCDDPKVSQFFHYFSNQFEHLGLKKLITTCYKNNVYDMFSRHDAERAIWLEYTGDKNENYIPDDEEIKVKPLKGNGDFRSPECIELLKQADIVCTNPPFSLFREYVAQLIEYDKKFLIIGGLNSVTYKEIFPLIKENKIWSGYTHPKKFDTPTGDIKQFGNIMWFTNLEIEKQKEDLYLFKRYTPERYPKYDNYDAIEVKPVSEIPVNWGGGNGCPYFIF